MPETVKIEPDSELPGVVTRAIGIVTSPRATFEKVVRQPKVLAIVALAALIMGGSQAAFVATDRGQQAYIDMQMEQADKGFKMFGMTPTTEQLDAIDARNHKMAPYQKYIVFGSMFIVLPFGVMLISLIFWAIFNAALGGTASFKQVMAVQAHTLIISALGMIFGMIMAFAKGVMSTSPANLGLLLPMLPEGSFIANLMGFIDIFSVWATVVVAIGLSVLYRRSARNIAIALFSIYGVILIGFAYFVSR